MSFKSKLINVYNVKCGQQEETDSNEDKLQHSISSYLILMVYRCIQMRKSLFAIDKISDLVTELYAIDQYKGD